MTALPRSKFLRRSASRTGLSSQDLAIIVGEPKLVSLVASRARGWGGKGVRNGGAREESAWRRELRSFNCLLEKLIKSISPEASRGARGAGLEANLRGLVLDERFA